MDAKEVGRAIAFLRKEKGYTQSYLAGLIGVSDKAVSKWERGMGTPDISLLTRLSMILDIDIEALLEGNLTRYGQRWRGIIYTENWSFSPDTPVYDKPLLDYIFSYFMLAGITDLHLFGGSGDKRIVESRRQACDDVGLTLTWEDAHRFTGMRLSALAEEGSLMIVHRPVLLYGLDLTKYLQRAMSFHKTITALVINNGNENHLQLPLSFASGHFLEVALKNKADSSRLLKEIEREGRANPITIGRGMISLPFTYPEDLLRAGAFVRTVQEAHRLRIADLGEIARRRSLL